jgi:hypothetical protein
MTFGASSTSLAILGLIAALFSNSGAEARRTRPARSYDLVGGNHAA